MDKLLCAKVDPKPWDNENAMEATDWGPESDTDSDENITFGTESNVYINHSRKPDRTTWLRKYLDRNASTLMTCEVFGCSYHTTHAVLLRYHYKTQHSSLMTNWSAHETNISSSANVSFQCPRKNCKFNARSQMVLSRHENKHKQGLTASCLLCNEICSNTEKFLNHVRIRHKIHTNQLALYDDCNEHKGILNIYRCNIESCTGFMSGVKSFYEDHLIHHLDHTSNTFSCGVCSLPLDTGRDLIAHFEQSHNKADLAIKSVNIPTTLSCDLCPYLVFNSNTIFILHHQLHHPELVTSVVDEMYPDFYKKSRRFKTFSTSPFRAEGEVECVKM
ncbi:unnamed protein product [Orchesella dallaii]|uniref:C2H2-type domain-containing protein n=1 Tax=Orchesella dallaii TaxID=48710 RepID=A0ABP1PUW9_9HEXA